MSRKKNTKQWFNRHTKDPFVQKAQKQGLRSRATFKLSEIDDKYHLFRPGMTIVELGAAPGSWTQYLAEKTRPHGLVVAVDLLPMQAVADTVILQGDIEDVKMLDNLIVSLNERPVNWVVSDAAPDLSGIASADAARALGLAQSVAALADDLLPQGGGLLLKAFQGSGFTGFLQSIRQKYATVRVVKPQASRAASREVYILGLKKL